VPTIATEWNPILNSFLDPGGVVVVLSGNQNDTSWAETYSLPGLFEISGWSKATLAAVAAPDDPVATGLVPSWTPTHPYLTYSGAVGGRMVIRDNSSLAPIVLHLERTSACTLSLDCITRIASTCNVATGECVECQTDLQCQAGEYCSDSVCRVPSACTISPNCAAEPEGKRICNPNTGTCVECLTDNDCGPGGFCATGNLCAQSPAPAQRGTSTGPPARPPSSPIVSPPGALRGNGEPPADPIVPMLPSGT
jgi:hypothetical protein